MANPRRGEATIEADGKSYTLRLDLNCLIELEEVTGRPVEVLFSELGDATRPRLKMLRLMFHAALQAHHGDLSLTEAGTLMTDAGLANVYAAFSAVTANSMASDDAPAGQGGEGDGAIPQPAGDGTGQDSSARE